jgi:hypothetical protein
MLLCPIHSEVKEVTQHFEEQKRRYPLLALRIYSKIMLGILHTESVEQTWERMLALEFAKGTVPAGWQEDYDRFAKAFLKTSGNADCIRTNAEGQLSSPWATA